jgi:SpoIID/LytB domain protein
MEPMEREPKITVGIMDRQAEVSGHLNGNFYGEGFGSISGGFSAKADLGMIVLMDESHLEMCRSPSIRLVPQENSRIKTGSRPTFTLFDVTIGSQFHWERKEDQTFQGDLILKVCKDGDLIAINEIFLEDYLTSVISSEMSASAPRQFLKAHAILSRSWLLAGLGRKKGDDETSIPIGKIIKKEEEVIRWYDREDHDHYDVCSGDHCQRYQGILKVVSQNTEEAVRETLGMVMTYQDEICDARYSKACGGITEEFPTAWDDKRVPYLASISDTLVRHQPIRTEEEALAWILSVPEAYCQTKDESVIEKIFSDDDRKTREFFRWTVEYSRSELEEILREKSGFDFGTLQKIIPLHRGPSGRISRLKIVGSKRSMVVGKELEIRRWLSRSHLYSSAFVVMVNDHPHGEAERFILHGAGWGHGVGLCQVGAAVMASKGFSAEEILRHYFQGVEIKKIY